MRRTGVVAAVLALAGCTGGGARPAPSALPTTPPATPPAVTSRAAGPAVGDCVRFDPREGPRQALATVPCAQPHQGEVYFTAAAGDCPDLGPYVGDVYPFQRRWYAAPVRVADGLACVTYAAPEYPHRGAATLTVSARGSMADRATALREWSACEHEREAVPYGSFEPRFACRGHGPAYLPFAVPVDAGKPYPGDAAADRLVREGCARIAREWARPGAWFAHRPPTSWGARAEGQCWVRFADLR
jgi:hypothetical protein